MLTTIVAPIAQTPTATHATSSRVRVNVRGRRPVKGSHSSAAPRSIESYAVIVATRRGVDADVTRTRGGVSEQPGQVDESPLPTPREDQIKHGPILAGVDTGVAGVDMVGRTYGASLFGRMTTYIN